jgi:hypothetical protein
MTSVLLNVWHAVTRRSLVGMSGTEDAVVAMLTRRFAS